MTDVVAVVTQPDRPSGRGHKLTATPVKVAALARGLAVFEPLALKPFASELRALAPDVLVVASYGRILPQVILDLPATGIAFNVHPSLLPLYRGATPLQSAIRDGRSETGVTIIAMDVGMDTGDILAAERTPLSATETYGELHDRLARLGADLLGQTITSLVQGRLERRAQATAAVPATEIAATLTRPLAKGDLLIDWSWPAVRVMNTIRALAPTPGARAVIDGQLVKIVAARPAHVTESGTTVDDGLVERAGDGQGVVILRLTAPNRPAMSGAAFSRMRAAV